MLNAVVTPVFFNYAVAAGQISLGIALLTGLFRLRVIKYDQRILWILVVMTAFIELTGRMLWHHRINNLFLYHFYSVAEFLLLGMLYTRHLNGLVKPIYMRGLMVAFVLFALLNVLIWQGLSQFNSHVTFAESLLLIVFAMLYFYKLLRELQYRQLEYVPMFWINMSVLTYFSGTLILFHVANALIPLPLKERGAVWGTHALFNIVHYALYAVALGVTSRKI